MLRFRSFPIWIALPAFLASPFFAQTAQTAAPADSGVPAPTLRVNARSVVVDVVVTDKNNKAVTGLPRDGFQVFEDGKPQAITFFEQHTGAAPGAAATAPAPPLPPNTFTNIPRAVPADAVNVLLMDALNTPMEDQVLVHKEMVKYLAAIPPGIRIAVFLLSNRLRIVQGFTEDSSALRAAIARSAANPAQSALLPTAAETNLTTIGASMIGTMGPAGDSQAADAFRDFMDHEKQVETNARTEITLEALQQIARYLAGVPGRKNLIWFASSTKLCITAKESNDCPYYEKVKNTENLLTNAQVSIYPIEASGLAPDPIIDASAPPITAAVSAGCAGCQGQLATQYQTDTMQNGTEERNLIHATMDQLARDTGGKAIYNQNGLKESLTEDIDNGARYYTIAYTPKNRSEKGKERKIEVKLASGKYNLAYRRSYLEDTPKELRAAVAAKVKDPLRPLMDRGMPNFTELSYRMSIALANPQPATDAPRAGSNTDLKTPFTRYGINFMLATDSLSLALGADGVRHGKIEVALVAYDHDGKPLNWMVHFVGLVIRPEQYEMARKSGIPFHLDIDVPPGEVYLRTGIFDTASSKAGTLEIALPLAPESLAGQP
jgi:VWFA-related protein